MTTWIKGNYKSLTSSNQVSEVSKHIDNIVKEFVTKEEVDNILEDTVEDIVKRVKLSAGKNVSIDDNVINVDTSKLVTKDETKQFVTKKDISFTSEANVGDVCFYDKTADKLIIKTFDGVKDDNLVPIGVVVIPSSHDVYGDGSAGVISLKYMSAQTPNEGSTSPSSPLWGGHGIDIFPKNFNTVPQFGIASAQTEQRSETPSSAYLPSDNFSGPVSNFDPFAKYQSTSSKAIPSPYLSDGSRNPAYYDTEGNETNALSDFDGVGNTATLCNLITVSDWKTVDSIQNIDAPRNYPAAASCWRYMTEGTNQGDWYLPACGELGYVAVRFKAISATISALKTAYGSTICSELSIENSYWSSSEFNSKYAREVAFTDGCVGRSLRYASYYTRAFLRVHPSSIEFKKGIESIAEETINKTVDTSKLITTDNIKDFVTKEEYNKLLEWAKAQGYDGI